MSENRAAGSDEQASWDEADEVPLYNSRPPPGDVHSAATTVAAVPDAILDGMKDPIVHSPSPAPRLALPPSAVAEDVASAIPTQALEEAVEGWRDLAPPIAAFDERLALDDFEQLDGVMLALPTIDVDMPLADLEADRETLPERKSTWRTARDVATSALLAIVLFAVAMAVFWQLARLYS